MTPDGRKLVPLFNDFLYDSVRKIAVDQGFTKDLFSVDFDEETRLECDGFISFVFRAIVSEDERELVLWCKVPPSNDSRSLVLFEREVFFYREILPAFVKFQQERGIREELEGGFCGVPKCYYAHCEIDKEDEIEAVIVLEYDESYERWDWDKLQPLDIEHAKILMATLGRLHAVSFAMKEQLPNVFEKFNLLDKLGEETRLMTLMKESFDRALVTMKTRFASDQEKIARVKEDVFQLLAASGHAQEMELYRIISHGDCWINNHIYRHSEDHVATSVILTDWQSFRLATPLLDIGYFFFICASSEFRKNHMDSLLQHYHDALRGLLDRLGGDTDRQFPFGTLLRLMEPFQKLLE
ncbi:uncharacterized protein LOC129776772 [Toxorhynchites rutilus septentrionalis]|uniref:uncharacterized protein LOC129776772 n=1 Tax=Toxorhynchites rutilus septentrionalis TaxID=329112 RepID=UPI002479B198|nr:uncharacterized protein LOC129776772 [Toxorhynchites rutilus septentrionalis]